EIEETQHLERIDHLRDVETGAEEEAGNRGGEEIFEVVVHQTIPVTVAVMMATTKKMATATIERVEGLARPQMRWPEVQQWPILVPKPVGRPAMASQVGVLMPQRCGASTRKAGR